MFRPSIAPCLVVLIVAGGCANEVEESTDVEHPRPRVNALASLVADYGGPRGGTGGAPGGARRARGRAPPAAGQRARCARGRLWRPVLDHGWRRELLEARRGSHRDRK